MGDLLAIGLLIALLASAFGLIRLAAALEPTEDAR